MKIKIDNKTMISVTEEYYATMKRVKSKNKETGEITMTWVEEKWFSSLESCLHYLIRRRIAEKEDTLSMPEFIKFYKQVYAEIKELLTENNVV